MAAHVSNSPHQARNRTPASYRALSPLTLGILTSLSALNAPLALAADSQASPTALQAENAQLRAEIEALKKRLNEKEQQPADPPPTAQSVTAPSPGGRNSPEAAETSGQPLENVVVSSRRKTPLATLKETPKSISVVSGEELSRLETNSFRNILTRIGNVGATYTNPQAGSLMIRGVGWASGAGPLDPSVGVTVDGVSYGISGLGSAFNHIDVDTVSVARGPQGTLGGKNASMGEIVIRNNVPSFTPEASASITYGQLNTLSTKATVGGPLIDGLLAWRGSFSREQADGLYKNLNDPNYSYKNTDRTYARAQFLLTPSTDFSALLNLDFSPVSKEFSDNYVNFPRATPAYYDSRNASGELIAVDQRNEPIGRLSRPWFAREARYTTADYTSNQINRLSQNPNNYGSKGVSATLNWNLGGFNLSSISAYRDFYFDSGGGPISVFDIDRSPSTGHVEYQQISQELRLSSPKGGAVDYQTGLYFFNSKMPERWTTARHGSDAGAYYASAPQYARLDADNTGRVLMQDSINRLFTKTRDQIDNTSFALYGNADWHLSEALKLNAGLRLTQEDRRTTSTRLVEDQGYGSDLNPLSINNVRLAAAGVTQTQLDDTLARKYFGAASYSALNAAQKQQITDARAIRRARLGSLYGETEAETFEELLPTFTISPSYKFSDRHTGYLSWQHGEKAGISQIVGASAAGGRSAPVKAEKSNAYELGLKSSLPQQDLVVGAALFLQDIKNYIQPMYFYDEVQTVLNNDGNLAYTAGLGNVPKVQTKGLELDVSYSGLRYTTIRFAGAYTDARYKKFPTLAKPAELGGTTTPYYDASGMTLPGSAKYTFNLSADYVRPVLDDKIFHSTVNYRYTSSFNNDPSLSRYSEVDAFGVTDLAVGLGRRDRLVDVNLIVKNVFNTNSGFLGTWNNYFPSQPRWIGVTVSTRLQ